MQLRPYIIVVDDKPLIVESVKLLLEPRHTVAGFTDPRDAIEFAKSNPQVHCAIVDYFMPGWNGVQVARKVKDFLPHCRFILLTGASGDEAAIAYPAAMKSLLFSGLVNKPIDQGELMSAVDNALDDAGWSQCETIEEKVEHMRRFIRTHFARKLSLPWLSNMYGGPSPRMLADAFRSIVGERAVQYLRRCRCEKALDLLMSGRPIKVIAVEVGYGRTDLFARDFKRFYGVSAGAMRLKVAVQVIMRMK